METWYTIVHLVAACGKLVCSQRSLDYTETACWFWLRYELLNMGVWRRLSQIKFISNRALSRPTCGEITGWVVHFKGIVFRWVTTPPLGGGKWIRRFAQQCHLGTAKFEYHTKITSRPRHPRNDHLGSALPCPAKSKSSQVKVSHVGGGGQLSGWSVALRPQKA